MSNAHLIADRRPPRKPHTCTVIVVDEAESRRKTDDEGGATRSDGETGAILVDSNLMIGR